MREKEKIKVIYIAGLGRSDSTLLERIIGGADNVWPLGEIRSLKDYVYKNDPQKPDKKNFFDESGQPLERSTFWKPIVEEIKQKNLKIFDKHHKSGFEKLIKISGKEKNKKDEGEVMNLILKRAKEMESEKLEYLLDASKLISRLLYLNNQRNIDLYVIHLVRDGRGTINSFKKVGVAWYRILGRWIKNNFFISVFIKRKIDKNKFFHLSYDHFTQTPEKYLELINKKFGTNIDLDNYLKKVKEKQTYSISGNSMRSKPLTEIKNDQQWKEKMPAWKKILLTVITYPFNKVWVYYEE
jgi:hypothetical protein